MRLVNSFIIFILFLGLFIFHSCTDDEPTINLNPNNPFSLTTPTKSFPDVHKDFWIYLERFENEAQKRGINADLADFGITAEFGNIQSGAAGTCATNTSHTFHHLTIDREFWDNATVPTRELILFHELGHCYLYRGHEESTFSDGTCKSIMRTGASGCRDHYNSQTREYYLDELFNSL